MSTDPSQLVELLDDLARAKETLAAAELDVRDRQADVSEAQERLARTERCFAAAKSLVESAWSAVRHRIEAQTHSGLEDELTQDRCKNLLVIKRKD